MLSEASDHPDNVQLVGEVILIEQNSVNFKRSLLCKVSESGHQQKLAADELESYIKVENCILHLR